MMQQKSDLHRIHKVTSDYGVKDYYKYYKKKSGNTEITYKEYTEILDLILLGIRDKMATSMYDFKLPHCLGRIVIRKYIPKVKVNKHGEPNVRLAPNWAATKQLWKDYPEAKAIKQLVYHTNEHSSGYLFTIDFKKDNARFVNRIFYSAQINRQFKRDVSRSITNGTFDSLQQRKF